MNESAASYRRRVNRFLDKILVTAGTDCWLWGAEIKPNGYGQFNGSTSRLAHRFSYEHFVGPIPEGLDIDHLCRVRHCVNPAHLEAVTRRENLLRGSTLVAKNARRTHCPQGHAYDEANTWRSSTGKRQCRACDRDRKRSTKLTKAEAHQVIAHLEERITAVQAESSLPF